MPSQRCAIAQGSPPAAGVRGEHRYGLIHYRPDPRPPAAAELVPLTSLSFPLSCNRTNVYSVHPLNSSDRGQALSPWEQASPGCERSPRPPRAPAAPAAPAPTRLPAPERFPQRGKGEAPRSLPLSMPPLSLRSRWAACPPEREDTLQRATTRPLGDSGRHLNPAPAGAAFLPGRDCLCSHGRRTSAERG